MGLRGVEKRQQHWTGIEADTPRLPPMIFGEAGETATSIKSVLLVEFGPVYATGAPDATASFMKLVEATFPIPFAYARTKLSPWLSAETGVNVNTLLSRKRYAVLHLRGKLQSIYDEFT